MAQSAAVSSKTLIQSAQYNNLRLDVLSSTLGHIHDGTDGRAALGGAVGVGLTQVRVQDNGLLIDNPAGTFAYTVVGAAIAADRQLNLPLITGTDTLVVLGLNQTFTANALRVDTSNIGGDNTFTVDNGDNTNGASHAKLRAEVGGISGGDPLIHLLITATDAWSIGLDNSASDQFVMARGADLGTNDRFRLQIGTGVLSVDGTGSASAAQVDLFDEYDDAIELRGFQLANLGITKAQQSATQDRLVELGVAEWAVQDDGSHHWMMRIQPMMRLLAGGVYQNRVLLDSLRDETRQLKALLEGSPNA
jgi:hypothetical protein